MGMFIWIGIIFVSVLVHEYGHAVTAVFFGKKPRIDLVALGGLTTYDPSKLTFSKQFIIVLNGPLAGISLALLATFFLYLGVFKNPFIVNLLIIFQIVNFFWSFVNLIPIIPLDGGQLLRIGLEAAFGVKGLKMSLIIGTVIATGAALAFFMLKLFLLGALFFLFAFQSFDMWRKSRDMTDIDRKDENRTRLGEGERALIEGNKTKAKENFEAILASISSGMIYNVAVQYLAMIYFEEGRKKEAYELFLKVKDKLSNQAIRQLHELAFNETNFELVAELSTECYQVASNQQTALLNARAFASLGNAKHAGGWLQTAQNLGPLDWNQIVQETFFDKVRDDPEFTKFLKK